MPVFVGLYIGDERLYYMGTRLQQYGYRVVDLENQHLTLLFIGDYKGVFLRNIARLLEDITLLLPSTLTPIELALLPSEKYTNIAVLVREDPRLTEARQIIMKRLRGNNVVIRDRYSFLPHVTIARRKRPLDPAKLDDVVSLLRRMQGFLPRFIVVRDVFLYETTREGYKRILKLRAKWV